MTLTVAGYWAEIDASGAQCCEARTLQVTLDRVADVQREYFTTGRDGDAFHHNWDARTRPLFCPAKGTRCGCVDLSKKKLADI